MIGITRKNILKRSLFLCGMLPLVLVLATGCSTDLDRKNPYDQQAPSDVQKKGSIRGVATLENESDFANVSVLVEGPTANGTSTRSDGAFLLNQLIPGKYKITVNARSFEEQVIERNVAIGEEIDLGDIFLSLRKVTALGLVAVQDGSDLTPQGTLIQLLRSGSPRNPGAAPRYAALATGVPAPVTDVYQTVAGVDGTFVIKQLPAGRYQITYSKDGASPVVVNYLVDGESNPIFEKVTLLPLTGAFSIEGILASGEKSQTYTADRNVTLNLAGFNAQTMRVGERIANQCRYGTMETFAATRSFRLSAGDGVKTLCVRFADAASNETNDLLSSIVLDETPPLISNLKINGGAEFANTRTLVFDISAFDDTSGLDKIVWRRNGGPESLVGYRPSWVDGVTSDDHFAYEVVVRDRAGNSSMPVSAAINVDIVPPAVRVFSVNGGVRKSRGGSEPVVIDVLDASPLFMKLWVDDPTSAQFQPLVTSTTINIPTVNGTHSIGLQIQDAAGNLSPIVPLTHTVDSEPPNSVSVQIAGGGNFVTTATVNLILTASGAQAVTLSESPVFGTGAWYPTVGGTLAFQLSSLDGVKTLYAKWRDDAGNESVVASDSVVLDRTPPSGLTLRVNSGNGFLTRTDGLVSVELSAVDLNGLGSMRVEVTDATNCNGLGSLAPEPFVANTGKVYTGAGPGVEKELLVCAAIADAAGNWSSAVSSSLTYDTKPPVVTYVVNGNNPNATPGSVSVVINAGGETNLSMKLWVDNEANAGYQQLITSTSVLLPAIDGNHTIGLKLRDQAGNESSVTPFIINVDSTPPTLGSVVINSGIALTSTTSVTLTLSASGASEFRVSESATFDGASWQATAGTLAFDLSAGDGLHAIYAQFRDIAGNLSTVSSDNIQVDTTGPSGLSLLVDSGAIYNALVGGSLQLSINAFDAGGVARMKVASTSAADCAVLGTAIAEAYAKNSIKTYSNAGTGRDETARVCLQVQDVAGNWSGVVSDTVVYDTTPPVVSDLVLANGQPLTTRLSVTATINASTESTLMRIGTSCGSGLWEGYTNLRTVTLNEGVNTLQVETKDAAGNLSNCFGSTITVDSLAPNTPTLNINSGAAITRSVNVGLSLSASGANFVEVAEDVGFNVILYQGATLGTTNVTLSPGDGNRTVFARFLDAAGNQSGIASDSIIVDTLAPTGLGLSIDNSAVYNTDIAGQLSLALSAGDRNNVTLMKVASTNAADCSVLGAAVAEAYSTNTVKTYSNAGAGREETARVCASFADSAGNWSSVVSATIVYDTRVPVVGGTPILLAGGVAVTNETVVLASLQSSGADEMQLSGDSGFAGASWQPYTTATSLLLGAGDGLKTVYVRFRDLAGNTTAGSNTSIDLDRVAPSGVAITGPASSNNGTVNLFVLGSDAHGPVEVRLSEDPSFASASWMIPGLPTTPFATTAGDGLKTIYARVRDAVGNLSQVLSYTVNIDTQSPLNPAVSIQQGAYTQVQAITVSLSADGADEVQLSENIGFSGATWEPVSLTKTFTLSATEGTKSVYVRYRDLAGNQSASVSAVTILDRTDPGAPGVTINGGAVETNDPLVVVTLNSIAGDVVEMQLANSSGFAGASWLPVSTPVSWNLGGGTTVWVRLRDASGRLSNAGQDSIVVDLTPPVLSALGIVEAPTTNMQTVTLNLSTSGGPIQMILGNDAGFAGASWQPFVAITSYTLPAGDSLKTVYAQVKDSAGNASAVGNAIITLDTGAPTTPGIVLDDGAVYATALNVTVRLGAANATQYCLGEDPALAVCSWVAMTTTTSYLFTAGEGLRNLYVKYRDAGLNETAIVSDFITIDTIDPASVAVTLAEGVLVNSRTITLNLSATDSNAMEMMVANNATFSGAGWEAYVGQKVWTLLAGDGSKSVYFKVKDAAGRIVVAVPAGLQVDTAPPQSPTFSIDEGVAAPVGKVHLSLSASAADFVVVSEDASFAGTSPVAFSTALSFDLSAGDGLKTVYVQFSDKAGNLTAVLQRTIDRDLVPPNAASLVIAEGGMVKSQLLNLQLFASGADKMAVQENGNFSAPVWISYAQNYPYTLTSPGNGLRTIYVQYADNAGNVAAPVSASTVLDTEVPTGGLELRSTSGDLWYTTDLNVRLFVTAVGASEMKLSGGSGCAGGFWQAITSPVPWTLEAGGDEIPQMVSIQYRDQAGNASVCYADSITVDTVPPSNPTIVFANGLTRQVTQAVLVSAVGAAQMMLSESPAFGGGVWQAYNTSVTFVLSAGDGSKAVYIKFRDTAGNESVASSAVVVLDQTAPIGFSFSIGGGIGYLTAVDGKTTLALTGSDSNGLEVRIANSTGNCSELGAASWQPFNPLPAWTIASPGAGVEASRLICAKLADAAGNSAGVLSDTVLYDTQAPLPATVPVLLDGGAQYNRSGVASVAFGVTGANEFQLSESPVFSNAAWLPMTDTSQFSLSNGDGNKIVYARFRDYAGNMAGAFTDSVQLDLLAPGAPSLTILGTAITNATSWQLALSAVGADTVEIAENIGFVSSTVVAYTTSYTYALANTADGIHALYVRFCDLAGNCSSVVNDSRTLDRSAPVNASIGIVEKPYAASQNINLTLFASGAVEMAIRETASLSAVSFVPYSTSYPYTLTNTSETSRYVYVTFRDEAGNLSSTVSDTTVLDVTPPSGSFLIENLAGGTNYTTTLNVFLQIASVGASELKMSSGSGCAGGFWQPVTNSLVWTLNGGGDGTTKPLSLLLRDAAGNTSTCQQDSIVIDTVAPSNPGMLINSSASYATSSTLSLALSAVGAAWMEITEDVSFTGAVSEAYATTRSWGVGSQGTHTLYVRYLDNAGNGSAVAADSIIVDTNIPLLNSVAVKEGSIVNNVNITLAINALGADQMAVQENNADFSAASWESYSDAKAFALTNIDGVKIIWVAVRDSAGNSPVAISATVALDTSGPVAGGSPVLINNNDLYANNRFVRVSFNVSGADELILGNEPSFAGQNWLPYASNTTLDWTLSDSDGAKIVYASFRDKAGNVLGPLNDSIQLDRQAPTLVNPAVTLNAGALYAKSQTLAVALSAIGATKMEIAEDAGFSTSFGVIAYVPSTTVTLSSGEGARSVYTRFFDDAGNESSVGSDAIIVDTQAPVLQSISINNNALITNNPLVSIQVFASDLNPLALLEVSEDGTKYQSRAYATLFSHSITTGDGAKTIYIRIQDAAGNVSGPVTAAINLDTVVPSGSMTVVDGSLLNDPNITVFTTASSDVNFIKISDNPGLPVPWLPYSAYTGFRIAAGDGVQTIYAKLKDAAGNVSPVYMQVVTLDTTPPGNDSFVVASGSAYAVSNVVTATAGYSGGPVIMEVAEDSGFLDLLYQGAPTATTNISLSLSEGLHSVYSRYWDAVSNVSSVRSSSIFVDLTPPIFPSIFVDNNAVWNVQVDGSVTLILSSSDGAGSGLSQIQISNSTDGTSCSGLTTAVAKPYVGSLPWTLNSPGAGVEGTRRVCVRFGDKAGNWSSTVSDVIGYDTQAPSGGALVIDSGNNNSLQSQVAVTFSATGASEMRVTLNNFCGGGTWDPYSSSRSIDLGGGNGVQKYVSVEYRDAAGNISSCYTDSITVDTIPPTNPNLAIVSGSFAVSAPVITLNLSATGADRMLISESLGFADAVTQNYSTSVTFTLSSGDGNKTVYAKFLDLSGNESSIVNVSVLLDQTAPSNVSVLMDGGATYNNDVVGNVGLALNAVDGAGSGTADMRLANSQAALAGAVIEPFLPFKALWTLATPGAGIEATRTVWIQVRDAAGNWSSAASDTISYDTLAPVPTTGVLIDGGDKYAVQTAVNLSFSVTGAKDMSVANGACQPGNWEPYQSQKSWNLIAVGEQLATVSVRFRDAAGNQTSCLSDTIYVDTLPPANPLIKISGNYYKNSVTFLVQAVTATSAVKVELSQDLTFSSPLYSGPISALPFGSFGPETSVTISGGDGQRSVYARYYDEAGNMSPVADAQVFLDQTIPAFASLSINNGAARTNDPVGQVFLDINAQDSVGGSGISQMILANSQADLGSAAVVNFDQFSPWTVTAPFGIGIEATKTVWAEFVDAAGNHSLPVSQSIIYDTVAPTPGTNPILINNGDLYTNNPNLTLAIAAVGAVEMQVNEGFCNTLAPWESYTENRSWTTGAFGPENGTMVQVSVRFRDSLGNESPCYSDSITVDTQPPLNAQIWPTAGQYYYGVTQVDFSVAVNGTVALMEVAKDVGFQHVVYSGPFTASGFLDMAVGNGSDDGTKIVYVRFADPASNYSDVAQTSIFIDTQGPNVNSVSIENAASKTNNSWVNLNLASQDTVGGSGVQQMRLSNSPTDITWATPQPFQNKYGWMLSAPTGFGINATKTVYTQFLDAAGNASAITWDTIVFDTAAPTGGTDVIVINGGVTMTTSQNVTLTFNASGATQMQISNGNTCSGGVTWDPYATSKSWTLSGGGDGMIQTVSVQFQDDMYNWSSCYSTQITVDDVAPPPPFLILTPDVQFSGKSTVTVAISNTFGGTQLQLSESSAFNSYLYNGALTGATSVTLASLSGLHTIYGRLVDGAGNQGAFGSVQVSLDFTAPPVAAISIENGASKTANPSGFVNLTLNASDNAGGSGVSDMKVANSSVELDSAALIAYSNTYGWTLSAPVGIGVEATKHVWVQYFDKSGNASAKVSDSIIYDQLGPQATTGSILIASDATYTTSQKVSLTITPPSDATEMLLSDGSSCFGTFWEPVAANRSWMLPSTGNGVPAYVSVKFRDSFGNEGNCQTDSILVDTVAPIGYLFSINSGNSYANSGTVSVVFSSASTEAKTMKIARDVGFGDIAYQGAYTDTTSVTLSGEGLQNLYIVLYDAQGNASDTLNQSIAIDKTAPNVAAMQVQQGMSAFNDPTGYVELEFNASDNVGGSGISGMRLANAANLVTSAPLFAYAVKYYNWVVTSPVGAGVEVTKTVYAAFVDAAGNQSIIVSDSINYDTKAPTVGATPILLGNGATATTVKDVLASFDATNASDMMLSDGSCATAGTGFWEPYVSSKTWSFVSGDGVKTLYVKYRDSAGNETGCYSDSITIDTTAPVANSFWIGGKYDTQLTAYTLTFSSPGADYIDIAENIGFFNATSLTYQTSTLYSLADTSEGTHTIYVRYCDVAGNCSTTLSDSRFVDRTAPSVGSVSIAYGAAKINFVDGKADLTLSASDNVGGSGVSQMKIGNSVTDVAVASIQTFSTNYYGWTLTSPIGNGVEANKSVYVIFIDNAGNPSSVFSDTVTYDTKGPQVGTTPILINGGAKYTNTQNLTSVFSVTGASKMMLSDGPGCTAGVMEPYSATKNGTIGAGDGVRTISVQFFDDIGNASSCYSDSITLDTAAPATANFYLDGNYDTQSSSWVLKFSATGADTIDVAENINFVSATTYSYLATTSYTLASTSEGSHSIYVRYCDLAGNCSSTLSDSHNIDRTGPTAGSFVIDEGGYTKSQAVNLTLTQTNWYDYAVSESASSCGSTFNAFFTNVPFNLSGGDGTKYVAVCYRDWAGNAGAAITQTIVLDTVAPSVSNFLINGGAVATSSIAVTLYTTASDSNGVVDLMVANNATFFGASWQPMTDTVLFTLSDGDATKTVYVGVRDAAGNKSSVVSDAIELDTTGPANPIIAIQNNSSGYTNQQTHVVELAASGASEYALSSTSGFALANWYPMATTTSWTLTAGDGNKQIYAKFRDINGNESNVVSTGIYLDTAAPTGSATINGGSYTASPSITLALYTNETTGTEVILSNDAVFNEAKQGYAPTVAHLLSAGDGAKWVYVRFMDRAGNVTDISSSTVTLDTLKPTGPQITNSETVVASTSFNLVIATGVTETNFDRYELSGGASYSGGFTSAGASQATTTFTFTLKANQSNLLRIRAVDLAGNISDEGFYTVVHDSLAPTAPSIFTVAQTVNATTFLVYLSSASSDLHFDHYELLGGSFGSWTRTVSVNGFPFTLNQDAINTLQIRGVDSAGNIGPSASVTITEDSTSPSRPILSPGNANVNADSVDLSLASASSDLHFDHYEMIGGQYADWTQVAVSASTVLVVTLEQNATNQFRIRGVDSAGNSSTPSPYVTINENSKSVPMADPSIVYTAADIWGDRVVAIGNGEVTGVNMITGNIPVLTTSGDYGGGRSMPRIWGNNIVYTAMNTVTLKQVLVYNDWSSPAETELAVDVTNDWVDIYKNSAVFVQKISNLYYLKITNVATTTVTTVTFGTTKLRQPVIFGDYVVYRSERTAGSGYYDLWLYKISTLTLTQITNSNLYRNYIDMWGDYVVWSENSSPNEIKLYQISSGQTSVIATGSANREYPAIQDGGVVWKDYINGSPTIMFYNLATSKTVEIDSFSSTKDVPRLFGNFALWIDYRNGNGEVHVDDLSSRSWVSLRGNVQANPTATTQVVIYEDLDTNNVPNLRIHNLITKDDRYLFNRNVFQTTPGAGGDKVVWSDSQGSPAGYGIRATDLTTGQMYWVQQSATKALSAYGSRTDGSTVVWYEQNDSFNNDVYMWDFANQVSVVVGSGAGNQQWPDVDGNHICFSDDASGSQVIMLYTMLGSAIRISNPGGTGTGRNECRVDNGYVVYTDRNYVPSALVVYNIAGATSNVYQVDNGTGNDISSPQLAWPFVTFDYAQAGEGDLAGLDLRWGSFTRIVQETASIRQDSGDASSAGHVFMDKVDGNENVYIYQSR